VGVVCGVVEMVKIGFTWDLTSLYDFLLKPLYIETGIQHCRVRVESAQHPEIPFMRSHLCFSLS
jgi:hypothetical protein